MQGGERRNNRLPLHLQTIIAALESNFNRRFNNQYCRFVPALVMQLLDFVALYGFILMPMGAIIFADFYLIPMIGLCREYAAWSKSLFSLPAALT